MNRVLHRYGDLVLTGVLVAVFTAWPALDLALVAPFYTPGIGFSASRNPWIRILYEGVARFWILAPVLVALIALGYLPRWRARWSPRRRALLYLLTVLVVGPGLIVNAGLKDYWGRPRPVHLVQFGGNSSFIPALQPDNQCPRNCAFVSGHAAVAFYPMALYWVTRRRRWLAAGIAFGMVVGGIRIAMGAHFLSDILFAGLIVHFCARYLAWLFDFPVLALGPPVRGGLAYGREDAYLQQHAGFDDGTPGSIPRRSECRHDAVAQQESAAPETNRSRRL